MSASCAQRAVLYMNIVPRSSTDERWRSAKKLAGRQQQLVNRKTAGPVSASQQRR